MCVLLKRSKIELNFNLIHGYDWQVFIHVLLRCTNRATRALSLHLLHFALFLTTNQHRLKFQYKMVVRRSDIRVDDVFYVPSLLFLLLSLYNHALGFKIILEEYPDNKCCDPDVLHALAVSCIFGVVYDLTHSIIIVFIAVKIPISEIEDIEDIELT